jgi:hypothetical protein
MTPLLSFESSVRIAHRKLEKLGRFKVSHNVLLETSTTSDITFFDVVKKYSKSALSYLLHSNSRSQDWP